MREYIIRLIAGMAGICGFSLVLRTKKRRLTYAILGGLITCALYFVFMDITGSVFVSNMIAAGAATMYAEITARLQKAPATVFLLPAIILLVPGGSLYYTMSSIADGNRAAASGYGWDTINTALGIAVGILVVSVIEYHINDFRRWKRKRHM